MSTLARQGEDHMNRPCCSGYSHHVLMALSPRSHTVPEESNLLLLAKGYVRVQRAPTRHALLSAYVMDMREDGLVMIALAITVV
jgi:hypothetical protein